MQPVVLGTLHLDLREFAGFVFCVLEVDLHSPARIIERFDMYAELMLPVSVTLAVVPVLESC